MKVNNDLLDNDLLTAAEIAESTGLSKRTIGRQIKNKNIPFILKRMRGGSAKMVSYSDLPDDLKAKMKLRVKVKNGDIHRSGNVIVGKFYNDLDTEIIRLQALGQNIYQQIQRLQKNKKGLK